jgi:two-component system chemotaxis response regulator CheB
VAMAAPAQSGYPWHPSTDRLVKTALNYMAPGQLVGVLMTGMGNDGAEAMALLHAQGGRVIAESEETAVVWGMPGELVKLNGADYVVPLPEIAENLLKLVPACR